MSEFSVRPETVAGDPFAAVTQCHCYGGFHYIGQICLDEETGEEVEVHFPVRCKRCTK